MVLEGLKDFYYSLEEKWYGFWDKVDTKIPVNGVIDAVDSVIPSFLLFLIVLFLVLVFGVFLLLSSNQMYDATFSVVTQNGKPVFDTLIFASIEENGKTIKDFNVRTDADGVAVFNELKSGQQLVIDINVSKGYYHNTFDVGSNLNEKITLSAPVIQPNPQVKQIFIKLASGVSVRDSVPLSFSCENSSLIPNPSNATYDGSNPISITEPVGCSLLATPHSSKYKEKSYKVTSTLFDLFLEVAEQPTSTLKIKIRAGEYPVNDTSFKIKINGKNEYQTETKTASEASLAVQPDSYVVSVSDPSNKYGLVSQNVTVNGPAEIVVNVSKTIKAKVSVRVVDVATNSIITGAIVNLKDSRGVEISSSATDTSGNVTFSFNDLGTYNFAAKKLGDLNGGYFPKEVTQVLAGDINFIIALEKITTLNAGKVKVKVIDQDGEAVLNAKVMLKYKENDGIVELYQAKNYSLTDLNGEATFLAGKVEGAVYAYAIKGMFYGSSTEKAIALDRLNEFVAQMQVGTAKIIINAVDEANTNVNGTIEILTSDGLMTNPHGLAGLVSMENGKVTREVKAGQTVYVRIKAETYEDYYTVPTELWPNRTYTFNVKMLKQISDSSIDFVGLYNENDAVVQTMAAGKKYYAKFNVNSDKDYDNVIFHFRAGKETLLENDVMQIDQVLSAGKDSETRGVTYDPTKGYSYDGANTTDGLAKWVNVKWDNFGKGTREVKVWFSIKKTASPNRELQFFYRGQFDNTRKPVSNAQQDFYADTYASNVYYVGTEAECNEGFCFTSEWLYSKADDLYISSPYGLRQINEYNYHFVLINSTGIDYGTTKKPIYMNIRVIGDASDEKRVKIKQYTIKDSVGQSTSPANSSLYKAEGIAISSFETNQTIDTALTIEGLKEGADAIVFELKSEGNIIYSKEVSFAIVKQKDFTVSISPQFITALINVQIEVVVYDDKGNYLPNATVNTYAKDPGYEQYPIDSKITDHAGKAIVDSGALFANSKALIEIRADGYARQMYSLTVSDELIVASPEQLLVELNTFSKREEIKEVTFANLSKQQLRLKSVTIDPEFAEVINQEALNAYIGEINTQDRIINAEDTLDMQLLRIRLANNITQSNFLEPINLTGSVLIEFETMDSALTYDVNIPLTLNVSSEANTDGSCLAIKPGTTTKTTERAQSRFDFEILNACATDSTNVELENLTVASPTEIPGIAEVSVRSSTGASVGRSALDGGKRILLAKVKAGEKLFGTMTFAPGIEAVGTSVPIQLSFEAKFLDRTIKSNPATITYTTNVVNLKECMSITSDAAPVAFTEKSKVTIDTTKCLGQMIDVVLCRNDGGCSGGAEGKITLSKKSFTLQNKSEDIEVYNPSLPGSYGVTVHARVRGTSGFSYIGELPVSFTEPDGKYFSLNKYELQLVGTGAKDSVILTNKMLSETVRVKATDCVFGAHDDDFSWSKALGGAMMGAMLGNMIGAAYHPSEKKDTTKESSQSGEQLDADAQRNQETTRRDSQAALEGNPTVTQDSSGNITVSSKDSTPVTITKNGDGTYTMHNDAPSGAGSTNHVVGAGEVQSMTIGGTVVDGTRVGGTTITLNGSTGAVDVTSSSTFNALKSGNAATQSFVPFTQTTTQSAIVGNAGYTPTTSTIMHNNYSGYNYSYVYNGTGSAATSAITSTYGTDFAIDNSSWVTQNITNTYWGGMVVGGVGSPFSSSMTWNSTTVTPGVGANVGGTQNTTVTQTSGTVTPVAPAQGSGNLPWDTAASWEGYDNVDYSGFISGQNVVPVTQTYTLVQPAPLNQSLINAMYSKGDLSSDNQKVDRLSFTGTTGTTTTASTGTASTGSNVQLIATVLGALIGGYIMGSEGYECDEHYQTVPFTDFTILLKGTTVGVTSTANTDSNATREVPSDAGELGFTLDGISPSWNFEDSFYSAIETAGIDFENGGLNDPLPRYGTLTVNATVHNHGQAIHVPYGSTATTSATSTTTNDYDVYCSTATFGNYWIGNDANSGQCTGISENNYSQKYHMRVISGEPTGEEAYIKKANSCYMGALTGSTGPDALPKITLSWDWDKINADTCDYTNPDYSYCDATQFNIALIKKLGSLQEFMKMNGSSFVCPPDVLEQEIQASIDQVNSQTTNVIPGKIGVSDITVSTINDETTVTIKVLNNTTAAATTYMTYSLKSQGPPTSDIYGKGDSWSVPVGTTEVIMTMDTPKFNGVYYFTAIINGEGGNRIAVTRAFMNKDLNNGCWIPQTTRSITGIPGLMYYVAALDAPAFTTKIRDESELYNTINFGAYLTKDAFTDDFLRDFKSYYETQVFTKLSVNPFDKEVFDYITSGNYKIKKKFLGTNDFQPGLYDVWINIDSPNRFQVVDGNTTTIEIVLLLVKSPSVDSPLYRMPFDGPLGEVGGRQGYGSTYTNTNDEQVAISTTGGEVNTFESGSSNGVTSVTVVTQTNFDAVNSSVGTRGQVAAITNSGNEATIALTPTYAIPVIAKYTLNGTSGNMAFSVTNTNTAVTTGGNLSYWTGAAKSKDFYGSNAVEAYNNSPDYKLSKLSDIAYGFEFNDASRSGNMYLKTLLFVPANDSSQYLLNAEDPGVSFWTPNTEFTSSVQLNGINAMNYNSASGSVTTPYINSLEGLFNAVSEGKICVSSDGSDTSFWWNPAVLENTSGSTTNLAAKELELVGQ